MIMPLIVCACVYICVCVCVRAAAATYCCCCCCCSRALWGGVWRDCLMIKTCDEHHASGRAPRGRTRTRQAHACIHACMRLTAAEGCCCRCGAYRDPRKGAPQTSSETAGGYRGYREERPHHMTSSIHVPTDLYPGATAPPQCSMCTQCSICTREQNGIMGNVQHQV